MSDDREARRAERAERKAERAERRSARQALREDPNARGQAEQFINRYTSGSAAEGYDLHEAANMFAQVRDDLSPDEMRQALHETLTNMSPEQRAQVAALLGGGAEDAQGESPAMGLRAGAPPGRGGASVGSLEDMLGGMIAGGAAGGGLGGLFGGGQPAPHGRGQEADPFGGLLGGASGGQGGFGDLGGLLGGLLGGGAPAGGGAAGNDPLGGLLGALGGGGETTQQAQPNPMNDVLKMILGGVAAYAMKQMLDQRR